MSGEPPGATHAVPDQLVDDGSAGVSSALAVMTDDRQADVAVDLDRWSQLLARSLYHEGVTMAAEVGLAFVGTDEIAALNQQYMDESGPTDVLSFPVDGVDHRTLAPPSSSGRGSINAEATAPVMVGDIVVAPAVAAKAVSPDRTLEDELALLVVHGALHLIGHDHYHPEERDLMQQRERDLLIRYYEQDLQP